MIARGVTILSSLNKMILDAPRDYKCLLLDMCSFSSPEIKQRLSSLMNGEGQIVGQAIDSTAYRANLRGVNRINAAHESCLKAFKLLKDNPDLLDCKLLPPINNTDYINLVLQNTPFKRVSTHDVIAAYFLTKGQISLHSCKTENCNYATLHNARKRVHRTHLMFVQAFHQLCTFKE